MIEINFILSKRDYHPWKMKEGNGKEDSKSLPFGLDTSKKGASQDFKTYIVYLECSPDTEVRKSMDHFLNESYMSMWPNEAHLYHPHCSLTGFFSIRKPSGGDPTEFQNLIKDFEKTMVQKLDEKLCEMGDRMRNDAMHHHMDSSNSPIRNSKSRKTNDLNQQYSPQILGIHLVPEESPSSLQVRVHVPEYLRRSISEFKTSMDPIILSHQKDFDNVPSDIKKQYREIRLKPMDHISLAYLRSKELIDSIREHVKSPKKIHTPHSHAKYSQPKVDNKIILSSLHALVTTKSSKFKIKTDNSDLRWCICLYELERKSYSLNLKHKFREVYRWNLPSVSAILNSSLPPLISATDFEVGLPRRKEKNLQSF